MDDRIRHKIIHDRRIIYEIRDDMIVILTVVHEHRSDETVIQRITGDA